jgi:ankyrin repeat protein
MTLSVQFGRSTFPSYNRNHTKSPKQPQPRFGMDEFSRRFEETNSLGEIAQTAMEAQENRDNAVKRALQKTKEERSTGPLNSQDKNGNTLLHQAASALDHKNMQKLLQAGANPTITNNDELTPRALAEQAKKSRLSTSPDEMGLQSVEVDSHTQRLYELF